MILRKREISLQFLGTQVLDYCPAKADANYINGYLSFVEIFFDVLDYSSDPFLQADNSYEADLEIVMELAMKEVNVSAEKLRASQREEFWSGVTLAIEYSLRVLKLAYNGQSTIDKVA